MNLNFLIKKKHIFKRRKYKTYIYNITNSIPNGIFSRNQFQIWICLFKDFLKDFLKKKKKKKKKNLYKN